MSGERLLEKCGSRGLGTDEKGPSAQSFFDYYLMIYYYGGRVSTLAAGQHRSVRVLSTTVGGGTCGHGWEREPPIKMVRGAGDKTGEGPQSCWAGRARLQGIRQLQPLVSLQSCVITTSLRAKGTWSLPTWAVLPAALPGSWTVPTASMSTLATALRSR